MEWHLLILGARPREMHAGQMWWKQTRWNEVIGNVMMDGSADGTPPGLMPI